MPTEKVTEFKGGKKRVVKRKLYPGYLVVQMEINDDTWFLVRETPGIGDFTGAAGQAHARCCPTRSPASWPSRKRRPTKAPKLKIAFSAGDRVKINEGTFENFEGEVDDDRRDERPRDGDDQHLRPHHARRIGILADRGIVETEPSD